MATCGNPPFSTLSVLQAEANFLALGGCLQDYDLDICTNYKEIIDSAKEPPRGLLKTWFTPFVLIVMGLVYNTKEASKPASYQDLLNPKYKGRVGIPTYGWVGNSRLQVLNKPLAANDNRFSNITMDGQYQMMMTQRFFYPPSNRNAKLPPDLARYAFPTEKEKNVVPIDYEKMNAHKSQYLDRWNKEVLGA